MCAKKAEKFESPKFSSAARQSAVTPTVSCLYSFTLNFVASLFATPTPSTEDVVAEDLVKYSPAPYLELLNQTALDSVDFSSSHSVFKSIRPQLRIDKQDITWSKRIGGGHFGDVYTGKWLSAPVVLKHQRPEEEDHKYRVLSLQFFREVLLVCTIPPHPCIAQLLGVTFDKSDNLAIVLQHYTLGSLEDKIFGPKIVDSEIPSFGLVAAVDVLFDVACACHHLHRNGLLHGDLASRNVLLSDRPSPDEYGVSEVTYHAVLTDFGLSMPLSVPVDQFILPSIKFPARSCSPEALKDRNKVSFAHDVWMFGVVMYEVVEKQHPYSQVDSIELVKQGVIDGSLDLSSSVVPGEDGSVRGDLLTLMHSCLSRDPSRRPDFSQVLDRLGSLQSTVRNRPILSSSGIRRNQTDDDY